MQITKIYCILLVLTQLSCICIADYPERTIFVRYVCSTLKEQLQKTRKLRKLQQNNKIQQSFTPDNSIILFLVYWSKWCCHFFINFSRRLRILTISLSSSWLDIRSLQCFLCHLVCFFDCSFESVSSPFA